MCCWLAFGMVFVKHFLHQNSKSSFCGGGNDSVAEKSEFVGSIVTGDLQLGITQPTGRPIRVSTQRELSLPPTWLSNFGIMLPSLWR